MNQLLTDLFEIMEDRYAFQLAHAPEYENCRALYGRNLAQIRQYMGEDFCSKLADIQDELSQLETEAAFAWGLRLGLALHAL